MGSFSTIELILIGTTIVSIIFSISALIILFKRSRSSKNLSVAEEVIQKSSHSTKLPETKIIEKQIQQIVSLEKQLAQYKREGQGIVAKWAPPREDKSAYMLIIYNDTPERIFNVSISIDPKYQSCCKVFLKQDECPPNKPINAFFIPGGWHDGVGGKNESNDFAEIWLQNQLEDITFVITYNLGPTESDDAKTISIQFSRRNLTKHLKNSIRAAKQLRIVSNK